MNKEISLEQIISDVVMFFDRNKKLIIIWPTVFREFDYYRLEIAHILKEIDVEIHEMVKIFNLDIEKSITQDVIEK